MLTNSPSFDASIAWKLAPEVSVRPEPFGALLYHFGNRRLTFLKDAVIAELIQAFGDHESTHEAYEAIGISKLDWPKYDKALASLVSSGILLPRLNFDQVEISSQ